MKLYESDHTKFMRELFEKQSATAGGSEKSARHLVGQKAGSGRTQALQGIGSAAESLRLFREVTQQLSCICSPASALIKRFKNPGRPHAGAHAHGDHAVFLMVPAQAVHQRGDADGAGCAEWMAQRNRAAQWIDLGAIQPQLVDDRKTLGCEGFVQFYPLEIVLLQANLLQALSVSP